MERGQTLHGQGDFATFRTVPFQARHIFARRVKLIAEINTLFEDVEAFLASQETGMSVKREKRRSFRRRSKKRHAQFVSLYGRPHVK